MENRHNSNDDSLRGMNMHAMKQGGEWVQISPHQFRELHPEKLIPDEQLEAEGLHRVETDPRPGTAWNQMAEGAMIDRGGKPVWAWAVRTLTPAEMHDARESVGLTKTEFLLRAQAAGLLSPADAKAAARGDVPQGFMAALPQEELERLEVVWPASTRVGRTDPLVLALAAGAGVTEQQLDALFGGE